MWTRREIKENAKRALERNYWKVVVVSIIAMILGVSFRYSFSRNDVKDTARGFRDGWNGVEKSVDTFEERSLSDNINKLVEELDKKDPIFVIGYIIGAIVVSVVVTVVVVAVYVFFKYPISVGIRRFMLKCVDDVSRVSEVGYAFDHNYKNIVKTMFFKELSIFLWSLLFVIPGIIKAYEYRMVEYILAENPDMNTDDVKQLSKQIMDGNKWRTFILDLSFIPWHILALITCGIAGIFYVVPYINLTDAALYRSLGMEVFETVEE